MLAASQSVKTTESGGICGYDVSKRIKGRKRHILTDTCGHLVAIKVHAASFQDRDGAPAVFTRSSVRPQNCVTYLRMAGMRDQNCVER